MDWLSKYWISSHIFVIFLSFFLRFSQVFHTKCSLNFPRTIWIFTFVGYVVRSPIFFFFLIGDLMKIDWDQLFFYLDLIEKRAKICISKARNHGSCTQYILWVVWLVWIFELIFFMGLGFVENKFKATNWWINLFMETNQKRLRVQVISEDKHLPSVESLARMKSFHNILSTR